MKSEHMEGHMSHYERILSEAFEQLTEEERLRLSEELMSGLNQTDPKIDEAWRAEVQRRRLRRKNAAETS